MCGKAAVSHLSWSEVFKWASSLTPPDVLPPDPESRINISPSRQRRKADPDSMEWETLPVIYSNEGKTIATEAIWPYLPFWSDGQLPRTKEGKLLSTANARLRREGPPFAPTFLHAWKRKQRVVVLTSWFYEFDRRVHPQIPWAVFPLHQPFWAMAGLASISRSGQEGDSLSTAIITVEPNEVLRSVGHHRSPALLSGPSEIEHWLHGTSSEAMELLRPHANDSMGVETVPMGIKIPGNQNVEMPRMTR